jgi:hypothetical protein
MSLDILNKWLAYKAGMASREDWDYAFGYAVAFLGIRAGRIWWENAKMQFRPGFVEAIDAGLAVSDPLAVEHQTRDIFEQIRNIDGDGHTGGVAEPEPQQD